VTALPQGQLAPAASVSAPLSAASARSDFNIGYCGYRFNGEIGAYTVRFRHYDPTPGMCRWLERDPAGYQDGPSLYSYLGRNPMAGLDPWGLDDISAGHSSPVYIKTKRGEVRVHVDWENNMNGTGGVHVQVHWKKGAIKYYHNPETGQYVSELGEVLKDQAIMKYMRERGQRIADRWRENLVKAGVKTLKVGKGTIAISLFVISMLTDEALANVEAVTASKHYRALLKAVEAGNASEADRQADLLYQDLLTASGTAGGSYFANWFLRLWDEEWGPDVRRRARERNAQAGAETNPCEVR
jgi:RHS repeat-associated protein